jgi:hypothetical protein
MIPKTLQDTAQKQKWGIAKIKDIWNKVNWGKAIRIVIILAVLALLAWPFLALANWLSMKGVYDYFVGSLSEKLGWNKYLIQSLVLVCLFPFLYGVKLFFSPLNKEKRRRGTILLIAMAVAYNLMFYFATKDVAFGFGQRETLKYYARTDKGIVFFDRPGFDPATGQALRPVTPEVVRELDQLREGPLAKVDPATLAWFNPYTGAPQLWYYRFPDGQLEFYNRPGMHPQTGEALSPVTKDLFLSWRLANQAAPAPGSTGTGATSSEKIEARIPSFRRALVAGSGHGAAGLLTLGDGEAADALARHLQGFNGNALLADPLRKEGFAAKMYAGDTTLIREAMAVTQLNSLVVAQVSVTCEKKSPLDPDMLTCDLTASARKFDAHGNPAGTASARGSGAGFNKPDAVDQAAERATNGLNGLAAK